MDAASIDVGTATDLGPLAADIALVPGLRHDTLHEVQLLQSVNSPLDTVWMALSNEEEVSKLDILGSTLAASAELAREAGQFDRSERAYRTLLMAVRRESNVAQLEIGPTEVLVEPHTIPVTIERNLPDVWCRRVHRQHGRLSEPQR